MTIIDRIAEQRIAEAVERGELDGLEGAGRPLIFDDDRWVPETLRAAYRLLRNAGYAPQEVEVRREIAEVEQLLRMVEEDSQRRRVSARLELLRTRLAAARGREDLRLEAAYRDAVAHRLAEPR